MDTIIKTIRQAESASNWKNISNTSLDIAPLLVSEDLSFDALNEDVFYIADMDEVRRQYREWIKLLPRVDPYYAVKCNPDPVLLQVLAQMGVSFDCASKKELESVLALKISTDRIIYANTCKPSSHLHYAAQNRVSHMTFDNSDELWKIRKFYPNARLLLRIRVDDTHSALPLGKKFGATLKMVPQLLILARHLGLQIVGISFHVGCGCHNPQAYVEAIRMAKKCFVLGEKVGFKFNMLDIGGGFPGALWRSKPQITTFAHLAEAINEALNQWFPFGSGVRIVAEPGRYFVERAYTLAVSVIGRQIYKPNSRRYRPPQLSYTISDGKYGSFHIPYIDRLIPRPHVIRRNGRFIINDTDIESLPLYASTVWGPTCDSTDIVHKAVLLPELNIGDWLAYDNMGAYTLAAASSL
ncbi:ornithine decarboxylase [Syncephalis fuscata]|nr:ornithine decarboxylase [Syncephalis fuscata]